MNVEVEIPDSMFLGKCKDEVASLVLNEAIQNACDLDFSGQEKDSEYSAEILNALDESMDFSASGTEDFIVTKIKS